MVTGTTAEEAEKWLAVGGSNLDTAVDLFFSGGNVSANHHSSSNSSSYNNSNRNSYNNNRSYSSGQRQINDYPGRSISHTSGSHNSDMLNYLEDRLPNSTQPDASIAKKRSRRNNNRNLSDEESAGRNIGIEVDEDGIRRPDKVQRITLVSETGHYGG